ncbi:MAG: Acetyl-CoA acetyltransferase [Smithella sp. PtaU1.Bin162]|nr:MAG: Acetyl-CoA acetyltransferase [Smithella sp. PtaU1.Bin162]
METKDVVIVSLCRTAIGDFLGSLKDVSARELAMTASKEAIKRSGVPADKIDELVMGQLYTGMQGSLPARQVAMRVGLPHRSTAVSVNQNCSSAMRALEIAATNIMVGKNDIALAVGVESMTNPPYLIPKARMGYRMGPGQIEDSLIHDGLVDELVPGHMGITAENVAEKYGITRQECDELAFLSHTRANTAIANGVFKREIVPVEIKSKKGVKIFDTDEHPMKDISKEKLASLPTAFKKDGVITAGNASGINDGAAAAVIMSKDKAKELGLKPLLRIINICNEGVDPRFMGIGPAYSIPKCLKGAGMKFDDIDYWEVNEAFSSQWLGVGRILKKDFGMDLSLDKTNHNGSGIALGHPVGCTGLRIIVSLYYELERLNLTTGGASLCVGGGPSMASLFTRDI